MHGARTDGVGIGESAMGALWCFGGKGGRVVRLMCELVLLVSFSSIW